MNRPPTRREIEKEFRRLLRDMLRGWYLASAWQPYLLHAGKHSSCFGAMGRSIWPKVAKLAEERLALSYQGTHGISGYVFKLSPHARRQARRILARRLS